MAQVVSGIRSILSHPSVYSLFQVMMGAKTGWRNFAERDIRAYPGMAILDIGCGPGDILDYLPDVNFHGYDISEDYIAKAKARFGNRGTFTAKLLTHDDLETLPKFDVVIGSGLLHHLDDPVAIEVMQLAYAALRPGGRFLTIDPVFEPGQNPVARFLISKDRGQNVRTRAGYDAIARAVFPNPDVEVRHKVWIPYTHCFMVCTKPADA